MEHNTIHELLGLLQDTTQFQGYLGYHWTEHNSRIIGVIMEHNTIRKLLGLSSMFPLICCSLCAQKLWLVRTFSEMINVCATTNNP